MWLTNGGAFMQKVFPPLGPQSLKVVLPIGQSLGIRNLKLSTFYLMDTPPRGRISRLPEIGSGWNFGIRCVKNLSSFDSSWVFLGLRDRALFKTTLVFFEQNFLMPPVFMPKVRILTNKLVFVMKPNPPYLKNRVIICFINFALGRIFLV